MYEILLNFTLKAVFNSFSDRIILKRNRLALAISSIFELTILQYVCEFKIRQFFSAELIVFEFRAFTFLKP